MPDEIKSFVRGDEIGKIKAIKSLKIPMINLFKTYPAYQSFGIIESYFKGDLGNKVVDILEKDGLIEIDSNTQPRRYRLTPKGIDFAISMINLEYSERVLRYAQETRKFNRRIIFLTAGLFTMGLAQLILIYLQNPIF